jgi:glycosyltransferase involved in cell wall biosynthesis
MKVALIVTGGLHPSGREQVIPALMAMVAGLARAHEIHAFVLRHLPTPASYSLAGATVHDLGRPSGRLAMWRALDAALLESGPFDVLHGYWIDPAGLLAAIAGHRHGVPAVVTCDSGEFVALPDLDYGTRRTFAGRAAVALACRLATRVHVTTAFMARLAASRGWQAEVIPMGIDFPSNADDTRPPEGPPWRLLQVGSLNRIKDYVTSLSALTIVRRSLDVHLDIAGEDTLNGALQRTASELGIASAVTFHGFIPNDALAPLRAATHLYVQSSRHEAAGVAVLEAAAAGIPVVGTHVGYINDWAPQAADAVRPGDPEALAGAIAHLLQNRSRRQSLAARARAFVRAHDARFTASAMSDLYASVRR